jgi:uncharacterized protein YggT (Ycf19 family)
MIPLQQGRVEMFNSVACGATFFLTILEVYAWIIIFRIVASWFNPSPYNSAIHLWFVVTDPALELLRKPTPDVLFGGFYPEDSLILGTLLTITLGRHIFKVLREH